ncbi:hypothetical protein B296_00057514, partial [Ensete ventricosum]
GLTATGIKVNELFIGDISTQYKSGKTVVDVKVDTNSNVSIIFDCYTIIKSCITMPSISTTVTVSELLAGAKTSLSFKIPDQKSGKKKRENLEHLRQQGSPHSRGEKKHRRRCRGFAGKKAVVAAEMTHKFNTNENSFTVGSSHKVDPLTMVKTRFSNSGKAAVLCQHQWRPKSFITLSAEYDPKAVSAPPKLGLALALKP